VVTFYATWSTGSGREHLDGNHGPGGFTPQMLPFFIGKTWELKPVDGGVDILKGEWNAHSAAMETSQVHDYWVC